MEAVKKEVVKEQVGNIVDNTFKEVRDLNQAEYDAIPRYLVQVSKFTFKKSGQTAYALKVKLAEDFKFDISLKENEYNLCVVKNHIDRKLEKPVVKFPVRLIKGVNKNGNEYMQLQVLITPEYAVSEFLKNFDILLMKELNLNVKIDVRKEPIDADTDKEEF
jgi:hypothetical protein